MARVTALSSIVLVLALSANLVPQCRAQGLGDLLGPIIAEHVSGLWERGDIVLLEHQCSFSVKPTVKRFELHFIGSVWCPGWTHLKGDSETVSRSSVVNKAVTNFMQKAVAEGLVTQEEAKPFLKN